MQKNSLPIGIIFFCVVAFVGLYAQNTSLPTAPLPPSASLGFYARSQEPQFGQPRSGQQPDPEDVKREKEREKARNKDRYASLKKDTDKLLQLATELKQSVDETTENKLSLEVIRKTDEIEKLAKKVRDKMKQ